LESVGVTHGPDVVLEPEPWDADYLSAEMKAEMKAVSEDVHEGLRPATADEPLSHVEWDELSKKFTSDQDEWPDILKSLAPACLRQLAHSGHEWWAREADWIRDLITLAGTVHSPPSKKETTVLYQMLSGTVDYAAASLDQVDVIDRKDRDIVATVH
jgi:hypothetical protein